MPNNPKMIQFPGLERQNWELARLTSSHDVQPWKGNGASRQKAIQPSRERVDECVG